MCQKIFGKNLVAARKSKLTIVVNKPAYVRICILDLCKVLISELHYDYIKNKYRNSSRLLFTENFSLMKN